ncbi:sentrin-specific protease 1-like [Temnothorax curvispinosus]|uniref:Sentrin-specific protease 1-like n=1 Tax=Temnothorax curvispinosus TaxID=300111 RepID=A0A6J1QT65_9HYME|nr:sentrin-specific protease 1-like [Temnothorax curvispinosus]
MKLTQKDLYTLADSNWLNDEVINFYMNLLARGTSSDAYLKVHAMNTFFYPKLLSGGHSSLKRWTRKVDIFAQDLVVVPVHLDVHWCIAIIDFCDKTIVYYDKASEFLVERRGIRTVLSRDCSRTSLWVSRGAGLHPTENGILREGLTAGVLSNAVEQQIAVQVGTDEYVNGVRSLDKKKQLYDMSDWEFYSAKNIPQHTNGSDCGVFSCMFAEYICANREITFTQDDMPYFRDKIIACL